MQALANVHPLIRLAPSPGRIRDVDLALVLTAWRHRIDLSQVRNTQTIHGAEWRFLRRYAHCWLMGGCAGPLPELSRRLAEALTAYRDLKLEQALDSGDW